MKRRLEELILTLLLVVLITTAGCSYGLYARGGNRPEADVSAGTENHTIHVDTRGRIRVRGKIGER